MELGSCFKNYEDFRECFSAYKKENQLQYGLKNCVSVRCHNHRNGTRVREDVTFMQVKFGCVQSRKYCKKRKQQPNLCPAYFVLRYNEDLDRLVISELNSNHVHAESKASSISSDPPPMTRAAAKMAGYKVSSSPPAKLRREKSEEEDSSWEVDNSVMVEVDCNESVKMEMNSDDSLPPPSPDLPHKESQSPQVGKEDPSNSALVRVAEAMKNFLRVDMGSLASISVGSDQDLERLNFQTSKMKSLFVKFPESLLLHRVQSERGHILYAFLVESKDRVGKLVHFAILKEDTQENARKMLSVFKEFNPEWQKVKVVFVDMSFLHRAILQELFPSGQVLLSVYHTVRLLEKKLKESHASFSFKHNLKLALKEAVFSTSSANLDVLSQQVKRLVDQELYEYLRTHWFSCEMLWYMHAKKGLHSCSTYIDSLDLITQKLSNLFSTPLSLEMSILRFVEYADCFNTKGLENLNQGFSRWEEDCRSSLMEELKTQARLPVKRSSSIASQQLPARKATEAPKQFPQHTPAKPVATMLAALQATCTDLAYQLCLNEWDVVQKSTQLMRSSKNKTVVQLLEDTHPVSKDGKSCSCYFHGRYQLPCRHILSVLQATQQVVEESMVGKRWQKKYQHFSGLGEKVPEYFDHATETQGVLVAAAAATASEEQRDKIQSLSKELGNLLLQSEGEELEERTSTLKMIVSIWTKCCELQEAEEEEVGKPLHVRNVGDLPFLWVKKEEVEVAERTPESSVEDTQTPLV
ncbi:zinc finger SWIM domain-containing protein 3 [Hemicordylus capensis]|uniref:zinc finger SWIM domain-containing protein 3 n=1 Tax=Hemicordylus capensis TaxID=884348 RepID=UPI002303257D|nr:zinc finger SWIM domain-containing protein 3 [Hemicordylus capensis]